MAKVGPMPLTMRLTPEGEHTSCCRSAAIGSRASRWSIAATGAIVQELPQASAFVGLAFSPDGRTLYSSGGNQDVVYRYDWRGGPRDAARQPRAGGEAAARKRHAGIPRASRRRPTARTLYVAENLADSLAVVDVDRRDTSCSGWPPDRYPYDVVVDAAGTVYVSAWGGHTVSRFAPSANGVAARRRSHRRRRDIRRRSLLNRDGTRLFVASGSTDHVAVVDTQAGA